MKRIRSSVWRGLKDHLQDISAPSIQCKTKNLQMEGLQHSSNSAQKWTPIKTISQSHQKNNKLCKGQPTNHLWSCRHFWQHLGQICIHLHFRTCVYIHQRVARRTPLLSQKDQGCPFRFCQRAQRQTRGLLKVHSLDRQVQNRMIWSKSKKNIIFGEMPTLHTKKMNSS